MFVIAWHVIISITIYFMDKIIRTTSWNNALIICGTKKSCLMFQSNWRISTVSLDYFKRTKNHNAFFLFHNSTEIFPVCHRCTSRNRLRKWSAAPLWFWNNIFEPRCTFVAWRCHWWKTWHSRYVWYTWNECWFSWGRHRSCWMIWWFNRRKGSWIAGSWWIKGWFDWKWRLWRRQNG